MIDETRLAEIDQDAKYGIDATDTFFLLDTIKELRAETVRFPAPAEVWIVSTCEHWDDAWHVHAVYASPESAMAAAADLRRPAVNEDGDTEPGMSVVVLRHEVSP